MDQEEQRYRIDRIHAGSLENNPAGSPVDRDLFIYLPPGYFNSRTKLYPVVYLLHGYRGNPKNLTVPVKLRNRLSWLPAEALEKIDWSRSCDYGVLDELITRGELKPFILVQPDGSLHLPDKNNIVDVYTGAIATKGSFYISSNYTGNYADYIVKDICSMLMPVSGRRRIENNARLWEYPWAATARSA